MSGNHPAYAHDRGCRVRCQQCKGETNESKTETVEEPGKLPETDHDGQDGPA